MKAKLLILLSTLLILGLIIYQEHVILPTGNTHAKANSQFISNEATTKIPNFTYDVFEGQRGRNLYDLQADKIYIHFWATWCGVCKKEFNHIIKFAKNNPSQTILAISIDDDAQDLKNFIAKTSKNKIDNLIFIWDQNKSLSSELFNTNMVPETYIVNNNFIIERKIIGAHSWN